MPLKRTPPPVSPKGDPRKSLDDGKLTNTPQDDNITHRKKRNVDAKSMDEFAFEMREMFSEFIKKQDKKLSMLQTTVDDIKAQNNEVVKSLDFLSSRYEELRESVDLLEKERKQNRIYVDTLESKIEMLERKSRIASLEIRNVPKLVKTESRDNLRDTIKKISSVLRVDVGDADIRDIFRINTRRENDKPIIVDFITTKKKEDILQGLRAYNRINQNNRLNTTQIGIKGVNEAIYISEYLTFRAKKLHRLARDYAKSNNYVFCWTQNGSVLLRKKEGTPIIKIDSESDLPSTNDK